MSDRRTVLVVEDHFPVRDMMTAMLRSAGYEVTAVSDALEAMAVLSEQLPDLVVTDYIMPRLDGLTMIAELRKNLRTATLRVLLTTAVDSAEVRRKAAELDVRALVTKPFRRNEFLSAVELALGTNQDPPGGRISPTPWIFGASNDVGLLAASA